MVRRFIQEQEAEVPRVPTKSSGTWLERRAIDFFYHCTSVNLSGAFRPDFWQKSVLQLSNGPPCLRHAIAALGAIHERFSSGLPLQNTALKVTDDRNYLFALRQYNAAINELRTAMTGNCPAEVILLCCILFVCFESFRSEAPVAMMHLKNGVHAIKAWSAGLLHEGVKMDPSDPMTKDLLRLVCRLGPQLTNLDMSNVADFGATEADIVKASGDMFKGLTEIGSFVVGQGFTSFEEARDEFNHILNMELSFFFRVNPLYGTPTKVEAQELQKLLGNTMGRFESWVKNFEILTANLQDSATHRDASTSLFLQAQYKFTRILISCLFMPKTAGLSRAETNALIESWTPQFLEVLELFELLITDSRYTSPSDSPSSSSVASSVTIPKAASTFYPEVGIISGVFLIGLGARDPKIRQRATDLLRMEKRREGTWDSETCWRVLDFVQTHPPEVVEVFLKGRYKLYEDFVFMGHEG